ncbi:rna-directed dna polymerase from mobile element jockey-like [Pitangus sulphuratus]|nr:rna-directed dna polymerase from mobile element jockey-like [Pitangus sulphuratus]
MGKHQTGDLSLVEFHGALLGPVLFNIFINDLDTGLEVILSKFTYDTKLGGAADFLEGREALQRDLDKLINHMKFSHMKGNCWILHLRWGHSRCLYRLGNEMLESSTTERDLGFVINSS